MPSRSMSQSANPSLAPALAVRTLGELTPERVAVVREACAIVEEEFEAAAERGEMDLPWQYFAALLPVRSVGVHGDVRAYGETIVVRAVQSMDGNVGSLLRNSTQESSRRSVPASRIRSRGRSTEWSTTSPTNPRAPLNGNEYRSG